ncbi:MAG: hypothetical protein GY943_04385 [Chloroflexi bacterium]|nr:hypothetical protein [Chloroflexota bacterium]
MLRKLSGLVLLLVGLAGVVLAVGGFVVSERVVDAVVAALDSTLGLTGDSLVTVEDTLTLAQTTIDDVNVGLETVEETADSLAQTISETKPLLDQVGQIASNDAPDSIESVQAAIPNVAEVAGVIDDTLITLNSFKIDQSILGVEIYYDLGIDYEPVQPFDETVDELGASLEDLPDQLRALEPSLQSASDNLDSVSGNIYAISDDLSTINGRIAEVNPLLTDYIDIVGEISGTITDTQETIEGQADTAKLVLKVVMVWLGFMQFALLYLGWDLMTRREIDDEPAPGTAEA